MDKTFTIDVSSAGEYVAVSIYAGPVEIKASGDYCPAPPWLISKPNWFERLLGWTWQAKIESAVDKADRLIHELEARDESAEAAVKKYKSVWPSIRNDGGYQPRRSHLDSKNPPQDGSGVPPKTSPDQIAKPGG